MGKLSVFNFITLDGYYKGANEDISWHMHGNDENKFAAENLKAGNTLIFGRVTYEMMAGFWPTPAGKALSPEVADGMNRVEKIVFSRTLKKPTWNNSRVVSEDIVGEIKKLKAAGKNMTILGSGTIMTQLSQAGLIDDFQFLLNPVILGKGTSIFEGIDHKITLKLTGSEKLKNGLLILNYQPV
jgi:dihydrofolate reductase